MQIRGPIYFISVMFLVLGFLVIDYSFRKQAINTLNVKLNDNGRKHNNSQDFASQAPTDQNDSTNLVSDKRLSKLVTEKFDKIIKHYDQISDDPELLESELQELAKNVGNSDISRLAEIIKNPKRDKKTRAIAIDVLAMSQKKAASEALVSFVVRDIVAASSTDTEFGLKAQAIEGIASFRNKDFVLAQLQVVKSRTRSAFISGRADLAIKFVVGQAGDSLSEDYRETQLEAVKATK